MKLNVLLRTVVSPFLLTAVVLWPPLDRLTFRLLIVSAISIWLVLRVLYFNTKKYLSNLIIADDMIQIQFITPLLNSKTLQLYAPDINELRLSMDGFRYSALGVLNIKANGTAYNFIIISNKVLKTAKHQITTSNGGFKKVGANFYLSSVKHESSGVQQLSDKFLNVHPS
jgi:hypothetical protein